LFVAIAMAIYPQSSATDMRLIAGGKQIIGVIL
jgi:hypothetical protein